MDSKAKSNMLDKMRSILREFQKLDTESGRFQFLLQRTGLDAARLSRIDRFGEPWPLGSPQSIGADEHEPSPKVDQHLETVATLSGEAPEVVTRVFLATIGHLQRLVDLCQGLCNRLQRAPAYRALLAREFAPRD